MGGEGEVREVYGAVERVREVRAWGGVGEARIMLGEDKIIWFPADCLDILKIVTMPLL